MQTGVHHLYYGLQLSQEAKDCLEAQALKQSSLALSTQGRRNFIQGKNTETLQHLGGQGQQEDT
jgi:hypothetical protein